MPEQRLLYLNSIEEQTARYGKDYIQIDITKTPALPLGVFVSDGRKVFVAPAFTYLLCGVIVLPTEGKWF